MAEAVQRERWNHTSSLLALLFNVNRAPRTEPARPRDFNPFVVSEVEPLLKMKASEIGKLLIRTGTITQAAPASRSAVRCIR
jgi:hypothetical protein